MKIEIKVPAVGESVKEAILAQWYCQDGEAVAKDQPLAALETDKVTLEVEAEAAGVVRTKVKEGETVAVGAVLGFIQTDVAAEKEAPAGKKAKEKAPPAKPAVAGEEKPQPAVQAEAPPVRERPAPAEAADAGAETAKVESAAAEKPAPTSAAGPSPILSPSVRRLVTDQRVDVDRITPTGPGGRLTKFDVISYLESQAGASVPSPTSGTGDETSKVSTSSQTAPPSAGAVETVERKPMSPIRRRIAERLLVAKNQTAMLTTFNEIDMSAGMAMRSRFKDLFQKRHEVGLGFMSLFVKASVQALKEMPAINAFIEGSDIVYHHYYHVGIAVGSPRGLVVPVIRHADRLGFADIERAIVDYVNVIKENRLEISDMEGGTFTITNGGVFGSLLSTPILNTPQSAILGMHKIEKRPVVVDDEIVIRPMMYVALSYDHRIVDGKEAVTFLRRIKECVENPERIMMEV